MTYEEAKAKVESFRELKRGWDSYDGLPINSKVIDYVLANLEHIISELKEKERETVFIAPTSDGNIDIEVSNTETDDENIEVDVLLSIKAK